MTSQDWLAANKPELLMIELQRQIQRALEKEDIYEGSQTQAALSSIPEDEEMKEETKGEDSGKVSHIGSRYDSVGRPTPQGNRQRVGEQWRTTWAANLGGIRSDMGKTE